MLLEGALESKAVSQQQWQTDRLGHLMASVDRTHSDDQVLVIRVIFCNTWKLSPDVILTNALGKLHNKGHTSLKCCGQCCHRNW